MATRAEVLKMDADHRLDTYNSFWYPGRGIVMGLSEDGKFLVQVYWITGRSENSQNRIFVVTEEGTLATAPADPSKVKDPSLIIYNAMMEDIEMEEKTPHDIVTAGWYAVSNGHQTEDLLCIGDTMSLDEFLSEWIYEPDEPNFTPRISGLLGAHLSEGSSQMDYSAMFCICKKSPFGMGVESSVHLYEDFEPGYGYCVTTYEKPQGEMYPMKQDNTAPLVAFSGEPYLMKLPGSPGDIIYAYWNALHPDNRISVAVKAINLQNGKSYFQVKNKHEDFGSF